MVKVKHVINDDLAQGDPRSNVTLHISSGAPSKS